MGSRRNHLILATGALLVGGLLGGCTDRPARNAPDRGPEVTGSEVAQVQLPHFEGRLPVRLQAGSQIFLDPPCAPDPDRSRICSADGESTYLAYPDALVDATLVDASMDPSDDRTEWMVTLTFEDPAGPRRIGTRALDLAGVLMVVDDRDQVLVVHRPVTVPERSIKAGRVTMHTTDKATAWDLVESLIAAE